MSDKNKQDYYAFSKGKLRVQTYCQTQFQNSIQYCHTVRETPDNYHIQSIKQYRKQLDEIRKSYQELRRAYYYLLGYRIQGDDRIPKVGFIKQKNQLCVTQGSQCNEITYSLNTSSAQINQAITEIEQNRRKITRLSQNLTQSIIQYRMGSLLSPNGIQQKLIRSQKIKTQYDQQNWLQSQLCEALQQNKKLRQILQKTRHQTELDSRQIKMNYEEHIRKLQQILQRERRHAKMLNGVISRMRQQINIKDNFIKVYLKLKSTDKNTLQKLIKQTKIRV